MLRGNMTDHAFHDSARIFVAVPTADPGRASVFVTTLYWPMAPRICRRSSVTSGTFRPL